MKIIKVIFLVIILKFSAAFPQNGESSLAKKCKEKLQQTSRLYDAGKSDEMLPYAKDLLDLAKQTDNDTMIIIAYRYLGNYYYMKDDHLNAIKKYYKGVNKALKDNKSEYMLAQLYNNIGFNYIKLKFYDLAKDQLDKGRKIAKKYKNKKTNAFINENLAQIYIANNQLDSAKVYIKISEEYNSIKKSTDIVYASNYIQASILLDKALLYAKQNNSNEIKYDYNDIKKSFLNTIDFCLKKKDFKHLSSSQYEYASFLLKNKDYGMAKEYALKSREIAKTYDYRDLIIYNAGLLYNIYENENNINEAYKYAKEKISFSDSLNQVNNANLLVNDAIDRKTEQNQIEIRNEQLKEENVNNLQTFFIGILLITAMIIFLLISRSVLVNGKFISYVGSIGLLIVFEFINMAMHPYFEKLTFHTPFLLLITLVIVASILIRVHQKLNQYVQALIKKNHEIRLLTAKKILEEENVVIDENDI